MSKYDVVLCRSFGDEPLIRLVRSVTDEGVLICERPDTAIGGSIQLETVPVLAPFDAIYEYDEELAERLDKVFRQPEGSAEKLAEMWQLARPYVGQMRAERRGDKVIAKQ